MKRIIFLFALFLSTSSFAAKHEVAQYDDIKTAIAQGFSIRIVTDFAKCKPSNNARAAATIMSMASVLPSEIGVTNEHIAASTNHFTTNDPLFLNRPVYEFVRYTLTPDNNAIISLKVFDATNYQVLLDKMDFTCKIGDATHVIALA